MPYNSNGNIVDKSSVQANNNIALLVPISNKAKEDDS